MRPRFASSTPWEAWTVRRKWIHRRLKWRGTSTRSIDFLDGADVVTLGDDLPVVGMILVAVALLLLAIVAVLFIIPALIFLAELLIIVTIVGLGLLGRLLFGRPWTVEAQQQPGGRGFEWKVRGWRASGELVHAVASRLRANGVPTGGAPLPSNDG